jgi:DNA-binding transcriptional MerR regulator
MKNGLTVGSVALAAGVTPDAVRYYERLKLISTASRTSSNYRLFDGADIDRVRAIRRAQSLGMSLDEIGALFPRGQMGRAECRRVRGLLAEKISETEARIVDLRRFRRELRSHLPACDRAISGRSDMPCPVFVPIPAKDAKRTASGRDA